MNKTVVIAVTGSIAAFKILDLVRDLKTDGNDVIVIMTKSATKIIAPAEFKKASGGKVYYDLFEEGFDYKNILREKRVEHIEIAKRADVFVICPATANTVAKIAHGIADDFLTITLLATRSPVLVCPAMNVNVWQNPLVEKNIAKLRSIGYVIIEPSEGRLACGIEGRGRLPDKIVIKEEIYRELNRTDSLKGKKILITSGGTSEKIDDVRYITNRSSGRMGNAIAEECIIRGADVFLLRAQSSIKPTYKIPEELFVTTEDLYELVKKHIAHTDIIFHVAAVSDFKAEKQALGKIPSGKSMNLKLIPQVKISDQIKKINPAVKLIAFKAEYGLSEDELTKAAENKLQESQADAIIANDVSGNDRGFEADNNEVLIIYKDYKSYKNYKIPFTSKREVAKEVVEYLLNSEVL